MKPTSEAWEIVARLPGHVQEQLAENYGWRHPWYELVIPHDRFAIVETACDVQGANDGGVALDHVWSSKTGPIDGNDHAACLRLLEEACEGNE